MENQTGERGRFAGLLVAQLFFIFVTPFVGDSPRGSAFLYAGILTILAGCLFAASNSRREFGLSLVILLPALYAWLGPDLFPTAIDDILRFATAAICFFFTAGIVVREIYRHERVKPDTILGGINVYLLLAFAFMFIHAAVMSWSPDAYTIQGVGLIDYLQDTPDSRGFATILYFSYTTMTTLGYGDIVPAAGLSRLITSAESVVGQLFVAIIIGRLVGLEVSSRSVPSAESESAA